MKKNNQIEQIYCSLQQNTIIGRPNVNSRGQEKKAGNFEPWGQKVHSFWSKKELLIYTKENSMENFQVTCMEKSLEGKFKDTVQSGEIVKKD